MKASLSTILLALSLAMSASAQPRVLFLTGPTKIQFSPDGATVVPVAVGDPAQIPGFGQMNIALYAAPVGTVLTTTASGRPDLSSWLIQTTPLIHFIAPTSGQISNVVVQLNPSLVAGGSTNVQLEVVGWTGNYANFATAAQSGSSALAWSGSALSGGALGWIQDTGTSNGGPLLILGASGFNGLVFDLSAVPEPSTLALGGLGAGVMLLSLRRRK